MPWEVEVEFFVLEKRCASIGENKTNTYINIKDSTLSVKEQLLWRARIAFLTYTLEGCESIIYSKSKAQSSA